MRKWEKEFFKTIYLALRDEHRQLCEYNPHSPEKYKRCHSFYNGIASMIDEHAIVYTVYKRMLTRPSFFEKWSIIWEDWYPRKKGVKSRHSYVDVCLTKSRKAESKSHWYYVEFGKYTESKLVKDYRKLLKTKNEQKVPEDERVNIQGRYLVTYWHRGSSGNKNSLHEKIEKHDLLATGKIDWVDKEHPTKRILIASYLLPGRDGDKPEDWAKGIFEIGFLKLL